MCVCLCNAFVLEAEKAGKVGRASFYDPRMPCPFKIGNVEPQVTLKLGSEEHTHLLEMSQQ